MSVVFNTFEVIEIDGIPAGNIVDVISNHASRRAEVLAAFGAYVTKLQTEVNAEKVLLEADKIKLTTDLAAKTAAYDAEVAKVTKLTTEKATLTTEKTTLTTGLATANATIATLQAQVAELQQYRPFNPRILKGEAFYARVSEEDRNALIASEIPELQLVGRTIIKYNIEKWPVILESIEFQTLIGYVQASGIFDQADVDAVMVDAKREEAYGV